MITEKQAKSLTRAIEKFNADFAAYVKVSGDSDLPLIDCTIVGYEPAQPYTCQVYKTRVKVTDCDGYAYTITGECELEEVKEAIKYDRRRLSKAWRVLKSENPDWELEHDTDEETEK